MANNWFKDMEKITICLGLAIIYLGINNFWGTSIISPALVTGISLSGLFLTIADFISKQCKDVERKWVINVLYFLDSSLYFLAATCIVGFPNATFIKSMDKETLDWMSTSASVVALGFVFVAIGISNRNALLEEDAKQAKELQIILDNTQKMIDKNKEILKNREEFQVLIHEMREETSELLKNKDKRIELLEKELKKKTSSV